MIIKKFKSGYLAKSKKDSVIHAAYGESFVEAMIGCLESMGVK